MIKELCLVPRYLVDKCFKSDVNIIDKKNIGNSELVNDSEKNNLYDEIKTVFKSKVKYDKVIETYKWIINNIEDLQTLKNGEVISPLRNFNLIQFFKDLYSNANKFSKEKLDLYKIWVSLISLPNNYIENKILKNYIYPNTVSNNLTGTLKKDEIKIESKKRKSEYAYPSNKTKKSKDEDEKNSSITRDEEFINQKYDLYTPRKRSLRSNKKEEIIGSSFFITKKPKIKWLIY